MQRRRRAHDLLVAAVTAGDLDAHGDRLVGLVGDDAALARLRTARGLGVDRDRRLGRRRLGLLGLLAFLDAPATALLGLALALGEALGLTLLGRARGALGCLGVAGGGTLLALGRGHDRSRLAGDLRRLLGLGGFGRGGLGLRGLGLGGLRLGSLRLRGLGLGGLGLGGRRLLRGLFGLLFVSHVAGCGCRCRARAR